MLGPQGLEGYYLEDDRPPAKQLPRIRFERRRLGSFDEVFSVATIGGRLIRRQLTGRAVDVAGYHADGRSPGIRGTRGKNFRPRGIVAREHLAPHRSSQGSACSAGSNRSRLIEAEPDSGDEVGGQSDEPDVGVVIGCSRFSGDGNRRRQIAPNAGRGTALDDAAPHIVLDVGGAGLEFTPPVLRLVRADGFQIASASRNVSGPRYWPSEFSGL